MASSNKKQSVELDKFNASANADKSINTVGFSSFYSSVDAEGNQTLFEQKNKIIDNTTRSADADTTDLLVIADSSAKTLMLSCFKKQDKNYVCIPKSILSETELDALKGVKKADIDVADKFYAFEIEQIDLIDSSKATRQKGFQIQLKGTEENKIVIHANARALQITAGEKTVLQRRPTGNEATSTFGFNFSSTLVKDCFDASATYANIGSIDPKTGELNQKHLISTYSTEFLLALAHCHAEINTASNSKQPFSVVDYGDLQIFHAPVVKGDGKNGAVQNSLIMARVRTGKRSFKNYVFHNGAFEPVSNLEYTYEKSKPLDIGIDFQVGTKSKPRSLELPILFTKNTSGEIKNNANFKILNAVSQFAFGETVNFEYPQHVSASVEPGEPLQISESISIDQADKTGYTEIVTGAAKEVVYSLNQDRNPDFTVNPGPVPDDPESPKGVEVVDLEPSRVEPSHTTAEPHTPDDGDAGSGDSSHDAGIVADDDVPILGAAPAADAPAPVDASAPDAAAPAAPAAPAAAAPDAPVEEAAPAETGGAGTPPTPPAEDNPSKKEIPNVKVEKQPSSLGPIFKTIGTLGMIAALFLMVGAVLLPGVAALVPAAIGCLCAGGALYFGSNFIDGKPSFDSTLNASIAAQRKRKNRRERQAEKFLKREAKIEELRTFNSSMDAKTKRKRLNKAQKLEDENFNALAGGNFRLINQIAAKKAELALQEKQQAQPDKEFTAEEISRIKDDARDEFVNDYSYPIAQSVMNRRGEKATRKFLANCTQNQREYIFAGANEIAETIESNDYENIEKLGTNFSTWLKNPKRDVNPDFADLNANSRKAVTWIDKFNTSYGRLETAYAAAERAGNDPEELKELVRKERALEIESAKASRTSARTIADKASAAIDKRRMARDSRTTAYVRTPRADAPAAIPDDTATRLTGSRIITPDAGGTPTAPAAPTVDTPAPPTAAAPTAPAADTPAAPVAAPEVTPPGATVTPYVPSTPDATPPAPTTAPETGSAAGTGPSTTTGEERTR